VETDCAIEAVAFPAQDIVQTHASERFEAIVVRDTCAGAVGADLVEAQEQAERLLARNERRPAMAEYSNLA